MDLSVCSLGYCADTIEVFMLVVDGVLYNESRSTLAALLALVVVVGRAFSRVSPALLPRFASLGQAAAASC